MLFSPSKDYELDAASSYEIQLDRVGEINNASLKNEALIQLEVQRAERLQKQVDEHEATKQAKVERLEGLQRLLSATQQQEAQLAEDIRTGEQFASCFKMRSMVDGQGEHEPDLGEDLEARAASARRLIEASAAVETKLRERGEGRSRHLLDAELESGVGDVATYARATASLASLVRRALDDDLDGSGDPPIAAQLHRALLQHLTPDDDRLRPCQRAAAKLEALNKCLELDTRLNGDTPQRQRHVLAAGT